MVAEVAQFISKMLPLTVGDGKPLYRIPFLSAQNPSVALSELATSTQQAYQVNPYVGDPIHKFDTQG